jgi:hypothetical protein
MPRSQIQRFKPVDSPIEEIPFVWREEIRGLSFPDIYAESESARIIRLERTSILEEIIRIRWDSTFRSDLKPPKSIRTGITLSANLWNRVIDLLLEIDFLNPCSIHPAIRFTHLIREGQIDCLHVSGKNKSEAIKIIQSQNQDLKALKNPFSLEYHYTHSLFENALPIAERMDRFRTGKLTPVREARENLTQHLRSEAILLEKKGEKGFVPVSGKRKNLGNKLKPLPHKG